jgi:hypothetical protein
VRTENPTVCVDQSVLNYLQLRVKCINAINPNIQYNPHLICPIQNVPLNIAVDCTADFLAQELMYPEYFLKAFPQFLQENAGIVP